MLINANSSDVFIVVRGVGERTQEVVIDLAKRLVGSDSVTFVTGTPFSETLKKSFEVSIARGLTWTFCVDADVLFLPESLVQLRRMAQVAPSHLFGIQGLVLDKFFGGLRPAGARLYRTELLSQALSYIPSGEESKRPETFVRRAMQRAGYEYIAQGVFVGLHDFEQYYRDIYRTAFFHAQKHGKYVPRLRPYWERMSDIDTDFAVALRGVGDGALVREVLGLDVKNFSDRADKALLDLGITEKGLYELGAEQLLGFVEDTVTSWDVPVEYDDFWRSTKELSRMARILGPSVLGLLGLSGVSDQ